MRQCKGLRFFALLLLVWIFDHCISVIVFNSGGVAPPLWMASQHLAWEVDVQVGSCSRDHMTLLTQAQTEHTFFQHVRNSRSLYIGELCGIC